MSGTKVCTTAIKSLTEPLVIYEIHWRLFKNIGGNFPQILRTALVKDFNKGVG